MSTKEVIAQDIITHEALYKASKLLDQFCDGMKKLPVLRLVRQYPELFSSLLAYTGNIVADEVLDAVFVHDSTELHPGDEVTVKFLKQYLQECSQEGKQYIVCE